VGKLAEEALRIEVLGPQHDRASFESGVEPLDRYFRVQAGQDARKNMAAPFVLVCCRWFGRRILHAVIDGGECGRMARPDRPQASTLPAYFGDPTGTVGYRSASAGPGMADIAELFK
jgi:hypothetical protein